MGITDLLLNWYEKNKRDLPWRRTSDPYAILVSEIMLQQTRVDTVISYYEAFMRRFPDVYSLASAAEAEVLGIWKGLGYYSRARNLQKAAQRVADTGGAFPQTLKEWRELPGVGAYVAGAVMSIALGKPCPAVDGNVLRVISRIFGLRGDITGTAARADVEKRVRRLMPEERASDFTQALMELGALVCKPTSPGCSLCPVKDECCALLWNAVNEIPVKTPKKSPREVRVAVAAVVCGNALLMDKREHDKLLKGMWGLPAAEMSAEDSFETALNHRYGLALSDGRLAGFAKHTFTHQRWGMEIRIYSVQKQTQAIGLEWVSLDEVQDKPVPKAFQRAIDVFREYYAGR